jgi:RHS repeat-associated protein
VLATVQASGSLWSYADLHGNVTVTTDNSGSRLNDPVIYDPWGQPTAGSQTLSNAAGGNVLGAFGTNSKLTDTATGITILGARAYEAAEGRFLSVDPIEGGCANNYVYVFGDPLSKNDLTGRGICDHEPTLGGPKSTGGHYTNFWGSGLIGSYLGAIGWFAAKFGAGKPKLAGGVFGAATPFATSYIYAYNTNTKWDYCEALGYMALGGFFGWLLG